MAELKAGDTVTLKSGGPTMTIEGIVQDPYGEMAAECSWFEKTELKRKTIRLIALRSDDGIPLIA